MNLRTSVGSYDYQTRIECPHCTARPGIGEDNILALAYGYTVEITCAKCACIFTVSSLLLSRTTISQRPKNTPPYCSECGRELFMTHDEEFDMSIGEITEIHLKCDHCMKTQKVKFSKNTAAFYVDQE